MTNIKKELGFDFSDVIRLIELEKAKGDTEQHRKVYEKIRNAFESSPLSVDQLIRYTREMATAYDTHWKNEVEEAREKGGYEKEKLEKKLGDYDEIFKRLAGLIKPHLSESGG